MLQLAMAHEDELIKLFMEVAYDDNYKFLHYDSYFSKYKADTNGWNLYEFASVDKDNNVLGYFAISRKRGSGNDSDLQIVNFNSFKDNKDVENIVFGHDLAKFLRRIIHRPDFRKLSFDVAVGNPSEKSYDKMISKYGGRVVGTKEKHHKLIDGNYYDIKMYEIMKENLKMNKGDKLDERK